MNGLKEQKEKSKAAFQRTFTICIAILGSVAVYIAIALVISKGGKDFDGYVKMEPGLLLMIKVLFIMASLMNLGIAYAWGRLFLSTKRLVDVMKGGLDAYFKAMTSGYIARFALYESLSIFGLSYFLIAGDWEIFLSFAAISMAAMFIDLPRGTRWEEKLEETLRAMESGG